MRIQTGAGAAGCGVMLVVLAVALGFIVAMSAFMGWVFMMVWNFAIVETFHAPVLDFWHSWAIWFLICLVGGAFRSTFSHKKD